MKVDTDTRQRITTALSFVLEFYKVLMGTFLTAFVPQQCDDHICSIYENITNTEPFHFGTTMANLFTFLFVLNFYRCELQRENWCIKYLDVDPEKPNDNLDHEVEQYPIIKREMHDLNHKYMNSIKYAIGFLVGNFAVSSVAIAHDYAGINTVTSLVSFFLLVSTKVYNAYNTGKISVKDERAFSAYMKTPITYNVIDEDHDIDEEVDVTVVSDAVDAVDAVDATDATEVTDATDNAATAAEEINVVVDEEIETEPVE